LNASHAHKKNEEKQIAMKLNKIKKHLYALQKEIGALQAEIRDLENVREEVLPDISELEDNKKVRWLHLAEYLSFFGWP
jgi:prefoldin subunit 5